jgi:formyltetrahydrofolate deformylase
VKVSGSAGRSSPAPSRRSRAGTRWTGASPTPTRPRRSRVLGSHYNHCLIDLLWRWDAGELDAEIPLVVSNHPDRAARAENYGIPFSHQPVTKETKAEQESKILNLLFDHGVNLVVLARYMQILSPKLVSAYPSSIINIHHSFLPAFA